MQIHLFGMRIHLRLYGDADFIIRTPSNFVAKPLHLLRARINNHTNYFVFLMEVVFHNDASSLKMIYF